jgi:sulfate adenylyltransferase subunit 2
MTSILEELFSRTVAGHILSSTADSEHDSRSFQRAVSEFLGSGPTELLLSIDASGAPQRVRILEALKAWAARKRILLEVCELALISYQGEEVSLIVLTDNRGKRVWKKIGPDPLATIQELAAARGKKLWLVPSGAICNLAEELFQKGRHRLVIESLEFLDQAVVPGPFRPRSGYSVGFDPHSRLETNPEGTPNRYLEELEAQSIAIMREAVASGRKTCMLFSMGKDSMVMLRLAQRAFAPNPVPFPLVVIDTRWKFQDMYRFRNHIENQPEINAIVHINPDAIARDVNPFDFGSATHTQITKTEALRQVLDANGFEMIFGGGRRDEEKSRAKERVFSIRGQGHTWNPREQRPELWNLYNTTLADNQTIRVFPISNWTEVDIWRYIEKEGIALVPLYFAKRRPVISRNGSLLAVDDERIQIDPEERIEFEWVRFRTLGCYPLTGAAHSMATSLTQIVEELESSDTSERISRVIDFDSGASMEQKKREGYF